MDPIEEILKTMKDIRQAQIEARETQLDAIRRSRRFIRFGALFFAIVSMAYVAWCWIIIGHSK